MRLAALLAASVPLAAQFAAPVPLRDPLADKNFYVLTLLAGDPAVRAALAADPAMRKLASERRAALHAAATTCGPRLDCLLNAFRWDQAAIDAVAPELRRLARMDPMEEMVRGRLRASGMYQRHAGKVQTELLVAAFNEAMAGINRVIDLYGEGKPPRYPVIDSATYETDTPAWARSMEIMTAAIDETMPENVPFFAPSLRFAVDLLRAQHRDEAGRHEPLEAGENNAAYLAVGGTDWSRYPYIAILVPGSGNDRPGVRMSPNGRSRLAMAARRWQERKAPFVVVSGGYVHPARTPFCEAIEMRRELVERHGIPAAAILIEPHARHTTTNIRNASRLLYRYGFPIDGTVLITTDAYHSKSIESPFFAARSQKELGYVPGTVVKRISPFDLEFKVSLDSLHIDPVEPLDP